MRDSMTRHAAACALLAMLAACSRPEKPPTDQPPEPTAATAAATPAPARPANVILDAYQRPLDRAKAVEAQVKQAAEEQEAAIEEGGG